MLSQESRNSIPERPSKDPLISPGLWHFSLQTQEFWLDAYLFPFSFTVIFYVNFTHFSLFHRLHV